MHVQFVSFFVDPVTREPLTLSITERVGDRVISGELRSATSNYAIVRGIPRFVSPENYAGSFGYQWNRWPRLQFDSENAGRPMEGYTARMFASITGKDCLDGQVLLDMGCGPGRFIETARNKGARVIGMDYSSAVEAAAVNFAGDPEVCICQADALALPLGAGSVDGVYSIGVLHHTPDPARGVAEASRVTRPEGWVAVSVYGKSGYYDFPSVQFWRRVFQSLWPVAGAGPALIYSYATAYGLRRLARIPGAGAALSKAARLFFPFVPLPDARWSLLDTFDSVTPAHQTGHTPFEVFDWMRSAGLVEIQPSPWSVATFRARRPGAARLVSA